MSCPPIDIEELDAGNVASTESPESGSMSSKARAFSIDALLYSQNSPASETSNDSDTEVKYLFHSSFDLSEVQHLFCVLHRIIWK